MTSFPMRTAPLLVSLLCLGGCANAASAEKGVETALSAVSQDAGLPCTFIQNQATKTACGQDAGVVSAVAAFVESVLAGMPAAPPNPRRAGDVAALPLAAKSFVFRGVAVTLPAAESDLVWAALKARGFVK